MGKYIVHGGNKLSGEVEIGGAKNAILPILAATILIEGSATIYNSPRLSDTYTTLSILNELGLKTTFEDNTITVISSPLVVSTLNEELVKKMRSSTLFMGSLLGRYGCVQISQSGGCNLGKRPIDIHLKAFERLGAKISENDGFITCSASKLIGTKISLDFQSVGATENIMLAAVLAEGETVIYNCAREPEIIDLQNFLNSAGAKISGAGTGIITIQGVKKLVSTKHTVIPDRIEAATYILAGAITGGELFIRNIIPYHIQPLITLLQNMGCIIKTDTSSIYIDAPDRLIAPNCIRTQPYPGFPTDVQPQMTALLSVASGKCKMKETIFEARNKHINELNKMGANIVLTTPTTFDITGVASLRGANVDITDLRCGAALIIAALSARGKSTLNNSFHVERGYQDILKKLTLIGGNITLLQ